MGAENENSIQYTGKKLKMSVEHVDEKDYAQCPRCYGKRWHPKGKMWYQKLDGEEILVCDRCHKVLYFSGHTDDFGVRWWDKDVLFRNHPEKDTPAFREHIKQIEICSMLLSDDPDNQMYLELREEFERTGKIQH